MVLLFCEHCRASATFLPIHSAMNLFGVSRSTIYYWIRRGWVHWIELPSGRRLICTHAVGKFRSNRKLVKFAV
jgi:predicted site-specific integrase-resolvase